MAFQLPTCRQCLTNGSQSSCELENWLLRPEPAGLVFLRQRTVMRPPRGPVRVSVKVKTHLETRVLKRECGVLPMSTTAALTVFWGCCARICFDIFYRVFFFSHLSLSSASFIFTGTNFLFSLSTSTLPSTIFCHRQRTGDIRRLVNNHSGLLVTIQRPCLRRHGERLLVARVQQAWAWVRSRSAAFRVVSFRSETVLESNA